MFNYFLKKLNEFFFFSQVNPMIQIGKKKTIHQEDTIPLAEDIDKFSFNANYQEINWNNPFTLIKSIFWKLRKQVALSFLLLALAQGISLFSPILIHKFIDGLTKGIQSTEEIFSVAIIGLNIGLLGYISGLFMQHYFYQNLKLSQKFISIINSKIFDHSLELSHQARQKISVGDVVNYMSSDADAVGDMGFVIIELFINILMVAGSVILLFYYLGITAVVSILLLGLLVPVTRRVAKRFTQLDDHIMKFRDDRLNLMGQILNAIRLIKYFVWEKSIESEVTAIRQKEVAARHQVVKAESLSGVIYVAISSLVLLATLLTHSYRGQELSLATIFTVLSVFTLLEEPFGNLTTLIARWSSGIVGAQRIAEFAAMPTREITRTKMGVPSVEVKNLSFAYNENPILRNLNFYLPAGQSLAVIGMVGSGKSTLMQVLLRELEPQTGILEYQDQTGVKARTAIPEASVFVPQESFIINSSLAENLLFGETQNNEDQLKRAIYLSCMEDDIQNLTHGLGTEIGEKGVNLSGGQKQRVSLARAILKFPDLILLDDPLAAVDVHTEDLLCERLLFGEWQNKTRLVVTHRLEHLDKFDQILFLRDGEAAAYGHFKDLLNYSKVFKEFYQNYQKAELKQALPTSKKGESKTLSENLKTEPETATKNSHRVTEDEERATGGIKKDLYFSYLKLLGGEGKYASWILAGLALSAVISKLLPLGQKAWLSHADHFSHEKLVWFFVGYSVLSVVGLFLFYLNNQIWFNQGIKAAVFTHDRMLKSILHAQIRFFDSTPVGRILQRFSRDQESMDVHLMFTHITAIDCLVQILISLFLIVLTLPLMLICIGPVMWFYYVIQNQYRSVAREVKRMDSIARSPRYAHFKETLQGLTVLRAYGSQSWFKQGFWERLQFSHKMFYNHYMVNRWFSVRVPLIGGIVAASTAVILTWAAAGHLLSAGTCGLVLVYAMSFWRQLNWAIRIFSDIEARMTSIERLQYYCNLPQETEQKDEFENSNSMQKYYDKIELNGQLEFQNVSVRYAKHLPLVLQDVSFKVHTGERVGIIGRTGSGKSTLFQALYRFVNLDSGAILIGGTSIQKLSLTKLRKTLAIIPQDPTLFLGTIRNNLDRYQDFSELELELVLKKACLWEFIQNLPNGLDSVVIENGHNFSQGQRQLLCLARALLVKAKIIILDEATASVDIKTDRLIQRILNEELNGVSLLIIAHRLETIKNCDQIVRLSKGRLKKIKERIPHNDYQDLGEIRHLNSIATSSEI
jgi:ABC-type multidrug transport system fused ATPase/permease subunit